MGLIRWVGTGLVGLTVAVGAYQIGAQDKAQELSSLEDTMHQGHDQNTVTFRSGHAFYVEAGNYATGGGSCRITPDRAVAQEWATGSGAGDMVLHSTGGYPRTVIVSGPNRPDNLSKAASMCDTAVNNGGAVHITFHGPIVQIEE